MLFFKRTSDLEHLAPRRVQMSVTQGLYDSKCNTKKSLQNIIDHAEYKITEKKMNQGTCFTLLLVCHGKSSINIMKYRTYCYVMNDKIVCFLR